MRSNLLKIEVEEVKMVSPSLQIKLVFCSISSLILLQVSRLYLPMFLIVWLAYLSLNLPTSSRELTIKKHVDLLLWGKNNICQHYIDDPASIISWDSRLNSQKAQIYQDDGAMNVCFAIIQQISLVLHLVAPSSLQIPFFWDDILLAPDMLDAGPHL